jgi:acyl dehydratase
MADDTDELHETLAARVGQPMGAGGPSEGPDAVNVPMIRHWVDALDDRNPVYTDEEAAAASRFGGLVAPPAMLQTWTMLRPRIEGIAARGGAADEIDPDSPIALLGDAGFPGIVATNSQLEFVRYLRIGDRVRSATALEDVSERKVTALGEGYFVTWGTTYTDADDEVVGRQHFRVYKFRPGAGAPPDPSRPKRSAPAEVPPTGEELPPFELNVTATVIVAGAIASRDFMPVHHDRDYANQQGAPDIFMNILSDTGYCSRFLTDWAGPDAMVQRLAIRLGVPVFPGHTLTYMGEVTGVERDGGFAIVDVALRATNELGEHVGGTARLSIPLGAAS